MGRAFEGEIVNILGDLPVDAETLLKLAEEKLDKDGGN